jgi:hypothetical protein
MTLRVFTTIYGAVSFCEVGNGHTCSLYGIVTILCNVSAIYNLLDIRDY